MEPEVIERFVRAGRLQLVFRDVLNHGDRSQRASEAAACAGRQDRFWQMHELLFEQQGEVWGASGDGLVDLMRRFGQEVDGIDQQAFAACLADRATLDGLLAADAEQRQRGITTQPIFEIGDQRLFGYQTVERIEAAIDQASN